MEEQNKRDQQLKIEAAAEYAKQQEELQKKSPLNDDGTQRRSPN